MAEELHLLRSQPNNVKVLVRFFNLTHRPVSVVWIDFTGSYVNYYVLENGQFIDINTYKQHPWIAFDHVTKDRLYLNGKFVYYPQTVREYLGERCPTQRQIPSNIRLRVNITLPLYSLKFRCLLAVRDYLISEQDYDRLELPNSLKEQLMNVIKFKSKIPPIFPHSNR